MKSDAQKRAKQKYRKEKCKSVTVQFYPSEKDVFDMLDGQENKSGYIKDLIRRDMERRG